VLSEVTPAVVRLRKVELDKTARAKLARGQTRERV
jgi:predicted membrane GTPase involved in stress response